MNRDLLRLYLLLREDEKTIDLGDTFKKKREVTIGGKKIKASAQDIAKYGTMAAGTAMFVKNAHGYMKERRRKRIGALGIALDKIRQTKKDIKKAAKTKLPSGKEAAVGLAAGAATIGTGYALKKYIERRRKKREMADIRKRVKI